MELWFIHYVSMCFLDARLVRCENGSWFNHVLEWWEAAKADPEHVMFLQYESMLENPEEHIRMIAEFAGIEHTPEIIAKVRSLVRCALSASARVVCCGCVSTFSSPVMT